MADIGAELTNSVAADGQKPMSAPLRLADGSVSAPSLTFNSETASGIYRSSIGVLALTIAGVAAGNISSTGLSIANAISAGSTATASAFIPTGSAIPTNGDYLPASNTIGWSTASTARGSINATGNWTINAPSSGGYPLTVNSNITGSKLFQFNAAGGASLYGYSDSGGSGITNTDPYTSGSLVYLAGTVIDLYTAGTARLVVNGTGNVIINAPSSGPGLIVNGISGLVGNFTSTGASTSAELAVTAAGNTGGTNSLSLIQDGSSGGHLYNRANAALNFGTNNIARLTIGSAGNVDIATPSSGTALVVSGVANGLTSEVTSNEGRLRITATATSGRSYELMSGGNNFLVTGSFGLYDVTRNAFSLLVSPTGNVTINAPTSGAPLQLNRTGDGDSLIFSRSNVQSMQMGFGDAFAAGQAEIFTANSVPLGIGTGNAVPLHFYTNSTLAMTIASAGNVTIAAPSVGNALLINEVVGGDGLVVLAGSGSSTDRCLNLVWNGHYNLLNVYNDGHFLFGGSGGATLSGSAAGNISIAAPSSGAALTVNGTAAQIGIFNGVGNNSYFDYQRSGVLIGRIGSADATSGGTITDFGLSSPAGGLNFATGSSSASRLTISSAGNVTIAAPSSGVALAINGVASSNLLTISDGTQTTALQSSGGTHYFGTLTNNPFNLMTNNASRMSISAAGAVSVVSTISASNFSGSSSGTNTGDQTNISGNASTATTASLVTNNSGRTDTTAFPVLWAPAGGGAGEPTYSCAAVTITSSTGTLTATALSGTSDERLKENIDPIANALESVGKLNGVKFNWKESGVRATGLIAQNVQEVIPEAVVHGEFLSVTYGNLVGLLVEAIKELKSKVEALESK